MDDERRNPPSIWAGQRLHAVCLLSLLVVVFAAWHAMGRPLPAAFWAAVAVPVVHQAFVWLAWRVELRSAAVSKFLGFRGYLCCFFLLFASRFATLALLAWRDRGSLGLGGFGRAALIALLLAPGLYAGYSVVRYFGMPRAAGADHFQARYRTMPLVRDGIFRFTNNGMYVYAFLLFWAIALIGDSRAALLAAAFSHAYIWVHYFATEKPDMDFLYGPQS